MDQVTRPLKIIIAEDQALMRLGLRLIVDRGEGVAVIGEARNGVEAVSLAIEWVPDLALLNWHMPRMDGLACAREIKLYASSVKTLVMSGAPITAAVLEGLSQGVDGFIGKDVSGAVLIQAIRTVCAGKRYLSPEVATALLDREVLGRGGDGERPILSGREMEVLQLMATSATYSQIADRLFIGETTVRTYVKRIFVKLAQPSRTRAVVEGLRLGIIDHM